MSLCRRRRLLKCFVSVCLFGVLFLKRFVFVTVFFNIFGGMLLNWLFTVFFGGVDVLGVGFLVFWAS